MRYFRRVYVMRIVAASLPSGPAEYIVNTRRSGSVNSLTHLFGYSNYDIDDHSRNNWLVALLTVGEGWHNNHHYDPASASNQHRWWELDLTYYEIKLLEKLGLATDVMPPKFRRRERRAAAARA